MTILSRRTQPSPEPRPDRQAEIRLCAQAARGDRAAAQTLAKRIMPTIRHLSRRLTRTSADAHDATQVALLEVLRSASAFRGEGSLRGWAAKIAMRAVVRWNARHGTHAAAPPRDLAAPPVDAASATMSTVVIDELPRPLEAYLAELSEPQRTALVLRHSLGCTIPEIAAITDSPAPTVKSRIAKALERIRHAIRRDLRFGAREVGA